VTDTLARAPKALDTIVLILEQRCSDQDLIENLVRHNITLDDVAGLVDRHSKTGNSNRYLSWNAASEARVVWHRLDAMDVVLKLEDVANIIAIVRDFIGEFEVFNAIFALKMDREHIEEIGREYTMMTIHAVEVAVVESMMTRCNLPIPVHTNAWENTLYSGAK